MARLQWNKRGERYFKTGVNKGVLFPQDKNGRYQRGVPWSGLLRVSESPTGAEVTPMYSDSQKYDEVQSAEEFAGTIEAYDSPEEFDVCDGTKELYPGLTVGQQERHRFGFSYKTLVGNDIEGQEHAYQIHIIYDALAAPTDVENSTINDSPEAETFSWSFTTIPVYIPEEGFDMSSHFIFDSRKVQPSIMRELEEILYGSETKEPSMPSVETLLLLNTPIDPILDNNSWAQIKRVATYISETNMTSQQITNIFGWRVGDTKTIYPASGPDLTKLSGRIIGFNFDNKADGTGKAGISFDILMENRNGLTYFWERAMNDPATVIGGWAESELRQYLSSSTFKNIDSGFPVELVSILVSVEKDTQGTKTTDIFWPFSQIERIPINTNDARTYEFYNHPGGNLPVELTRGNYRFWIRNHHTGGANNFTTLTERLVDGDPDTVYPYAFSLPTNTPAAIVFGFCI